MRIALFVSILLAPVVASAQPADESVDALASGGFIIGDRFNADNRIGIEASYLATRGDFFGGDRGGDVHGHYIDRASGFGGYASISYASAATHYDGNQGFFGAFGDLQVGGLFATTVSSHTALIFRAGGILPTATDADIDKEEANVAAGYRRSTDLALSLSKVKGARLALSPIVRNGNLFARADVGVDLIWTNYGSYAIDNAFETLLRVNGGVGVDLHPVQLMLELAHVSVLSDEAMIDSRVSTTSLAAGARIPFDSVELLFALVVPANAAYKLCATAGFEIRL